ncbi:hypothetical protein MSSAC_4145 [Methanosarcina siciliae C2J]|uniref:Uncharacterized protein n=1 Tax=Methanosarcina siciliae C2J TaxID=1434118 RepID=A0A0E3PTU1_9EURY|nr:hypothetical protein MSSAC_4145 [Methanosarcina siciliae C2J]
MALNKLSLENIEILYYYAILINLNVDIIDPFSRFSGSYAFLFSLSYMDGVRKIKRSRIFILGCTFVSLIR